MNETHEKPVDVSNFITSASNEFVKNVGRLWYLINPRDTTFEFPHQVPDYQQQVWLSFFVLIILENVILCAKKKKLFRLNDHVTSVSHWIFQESGRILFRGAEYYTYISIYEKYRLWSLPWDSLWTWYVTAIGVDFCYYWVHRANHEIHFLWAHHQVHHSSEEFNLVVGLRQSVLQHWCSFLFYLPLAFFIPPSHFVAHHQFNLIYQLWIHTTVIDDLGPLELIFNTPKHHRVHHGCNLYCLDKNYGGVLIIWDRMFGTFVAQKPEEDIIYGLVVSPQTFNPLYLQIFIPSRSVCNFLSFLCNLCGLNTTRKDYLNNNSDIFYVKSMITKSLSMESLGDKLGVLWKGPSWFPGVPRLGLDEFKVNVTSRIKYDPYLPTWQSLYVTLHFFVVLYTHFHLYDERRESSYFNSSTIVLNNVFTLTAIGLLFDKYEYASVVELVRCAVHLAVLKYDRETSPRLANQMIYYLYLASWCIWIVYFLRKIKFNIKF